jgi:short-subunit dehydrogenase
MSRRHIAGLRTLVTGASSGIGGALAVQLASQGAKVVLVARREDRLREVMARVPAEARTNAIAVAGDVTEAASRERAIAAAVREFGGLDCLVNNAGVGAQGRFLGHRGIPYSSEYCASKFAVRGFSEALRAELLRERIEVLLVSPGTTESEFFERLIEAGEKPPWPEQPPVPAEVVARRIVRAMERRRHEIIPNARGRMMVWLNRLAPRVVDAWMGRYG